MSKFVRPLQINGPLHLDTLFGKYGSYFISNFVKENNVFSKLYIFIEGLFKKQNIAIKNVQTITIIAKSRN